MSFCPNCGMENAANATECRRCHVPLEMHAEAPPAPPPAPAAAAADQLSEQLGEVCRRCESYNEPGTHRCTTCGYKMILDPGDPGYVAPAGAAPEAEAPAHEEPLPEEHPALQALAADVHHDEAAHEEPPAHQFADHTPPTPVPAHISTDTPPDGMRAVRAAAKPVAEEESHRDLASAIASAQPPPDHTPPDPIPAPAPAPVRAPTRPPPPQLSRPPAAAPAPAPAPAAAAPSAPPARRAPPSISAAPAATATASAPAPVLKSAPPPPAKAPAAPPPVAAPPETPPPAVEMKACPECGNKNPPAAKFCAECGTPFTKPAPKAVVKVAPLPPKVVAPVEPEPSIHVEPELHHVEPDEVPALHAATHEEAFGHEEAHPPTSIDEGVPAHLQAEHDASDDAGVSERIDPDAYEAVEELQAEPLPEEVPEEAVEEVPQEAPIEEVAEEQYAVEEVQPEPEPLPPSQREAPFHASLVVERGSAAGSTFVLAHVESSLGAEGAAVAFHDDPHVAPLAATFLFEDGAEPPAEHARLILRDEPGQAPTAESPHVEGMRYTSGEDAPANGHRLLLRDEASTNGVFVRVRGSIRLEAGDLFAAGERTLRYDGPQDLPAPAEGETPVLGSPRPAGAALRITEVLQGGRAGRTCHRSGPVIAVGRTGCDMNFPSDTLLAARHAEVRVDENGNALLCDLGSSPEGVFVRLRPQAEYEVQAGAMLRVGAQLLKIELG